MKKIILSLVVVSSIFGVQAMASDTTSLTRATVKLIKSQQDLNSQVNGIHKIAESNIELINKTNDLIKNLEGEVSKINKNMSEGSSLSSSNSQQITILHNKVEEAKVIAQRAEQSANEAKGLVAEMKGLSNKYKEESGRVISSAETAYEKSNIIEEKNKILEGSIVRNSEKVNAQDLKISQLQAEIDFLKKSSNSSVTDKKMIDNTKVNDLEKKLAEMIIKYDNAIESLKSNPSNFKEPTEINCTGKKCESNKNAEMIIQSYIK